MKADSQGRGVFIIPSGGIDARFLRMVAHMYGASDEVGNYLSVGQRQVLSVEQTDPLVIPLEGRIKEDYEKWLKAESEMRQKTKQPTLELIGNDTLEALYGEDLVRRWMPTAAIKTRLEGNLAIGTNKPGSEQLTRKAVNVSEVHLKIVREHGTILLYGMRPRTGLYVLEMDASKGYPLPKLTPMV